MTIIGVALLVVAVGIVYGGILKIVAWAGGEQLEAPGTLALWAALLSIVLKEAVYHYSMMKARQLQSQAVEANAWHHAATLYRPLVRPSASVALSSLVSAGGCSIL